MPFLRLLARLPISLGYALSVPLAWLLSLAYRRSLVRDNLERSFPELSVAERRKIAAAFYRNLVEVAWESIQSSRMSEEEILERVTVIVPDDFTRYRETNDSIILLGAHQANWELFLLACSLRLPFPLEVVYRPLHSSAFEQFMAESRARFGAKLIPDRIAIKTVMANHGSSRAVSMMADQRPPRKEPRHWTTMLNQDTAFHTGWAKIAQFTKYPVWYAHSRRIARGRYEISFRKICAAPYPRKVGPLIEVLSGELEEAIKNDPAEWLWSHTRWREPKPLYE